MNETPKYGEYSKQFLTNVPADLTSEEAAYFKKVIPKFPEEGVYIYSFVEGKMIYADGWEEVIGMASNKISMLPVVNMTAPEQANFVHEMNDKAMMFLNEKTEDLRSIALPLR